MEDAFYIFYGVAIGLVVIYCIFAAYGNDIRRNKYSNKVDRFKKKVERINKGMNRDEILNILGQPEKKITDLGWRKVPDSNHDYKEY